MVHACTILHNMIIVERFGDRFGESTDDIDDDNEATTGFPLFGKQQVSAEDIAHDHVDLFGARVAAFDSNMQSKWEHFKLKEDAVEHVYAQFHP